MIDGLVFSIGLLVVLITAAATFVIGLQEAADPTSSRPEDLTKFEQRVTGRGGRAANDDEPSS